MLRDGACDLVRFPQEEGRFGVEFEDFRSAFGQRDIEAPQCRGAHGGVGAAHDIARGLRDTDRRELFIREMLKHRQDALEDLPRIARSGAQHRRRFAGDPVRLEERVRMALHGGPEVGEALREKGEPARVVHERSRASAARVACCPGLAEAAVRLGFA